MNADAPPPATASTPALEPVHDFTRKLRQEGLLERVIEYVAWQKARRTARAEGTQEPSLPAWSPLSINLDLTTACNYACDHCIDWDILNSGISHEDEVLRQSLAEMRDRGLKSVILIGGGEPTVYPRFADMVRYIKSLELQVAVVTNGSRNERILEVADCLDSRDWVRLSLDSGTDATFQAMHNPKKAITLEAICAGIPPIRELNPAPRIGFSYVIVWDGAERAEGAPPVVENIDEIAMAARLARDHGFHYISFKPMLTRAPDGAEVMDPEAAHAALESVLRRIRAQLDQAHTVATSDFAVIESTNLKLLEQGTWREWTSQPRTCHMQALRQVLSPLGLWNCPAHRGVTKARIAPKDAFADGERAERTAEAVEGMLDGFDASVECREVTCLYHATNWWLEQAIEDPRGLDDLTAVDGNDAFL
ncbi:MAG: radical SAM protein [Planctomycetota bacterium]|nr:radical SAM protein [Planctomycetota bacterium]